MECRQFTFSNLLTIAIRRYILVFVLNQLLYSQHLSLNGFSSVLHFFSYVVLSVFLRVFSNPSYPYSLNSCVSCDAFVSFIYLCFIISFPIQSQLIFVEFPPQLPLSSFNSYAEWSKSFVILYGPSKTYINFDVIPLIASAMGGVLTSTFSFSLGVKMANPFFRRLSISAAFCFIF